MTEKDYQDWDIDLCDKCKRITENVNIINEKLFKTECIGFMKDKDITDEHDRANSIRLCVFNFQKDEVDTTEYTPLECMQLCDILHQAVMNYLLTDQKRAERRAKKR